MSRSEGQASGPEPGGQPPWIKVENLSYRVGSASLLQDVSFEAHSGELIALVGPNGAGKSTMLSLLSGDATPTSGRVRLFGREPQLWQPLEFARLRSMMTQHNDQAFAFRVDETVAMGRAPHPPTAADEDIVRAALQATEVVHLSRREVTTLSGGEAARTVFSRVLAQETKLVLLDEPTAPLDLKHQESLLRHAQALTEKGGCVIVVLHDLSLAARYCNRIAMFAKSRLVALGPPEQVLTAERVAEVYGQEVEIVPHPRTGRPMVIPV